LIIGKLVEDLDTTEKSDESRSGSALIKFVLRRW